MDGMDGSMACKYLAHIHDTSTASPDMVTSKVIAKSTVAHLYQYHGNNTHCCLVGPFVRSTSPVSVSKYNKCRSPPSSVSVFHLHIHSHPSVFLRSLPPKLPDNDHTTL